MSLHSQPGQRATILYPKHRSLTSSPLITLSPDKLAVALLGGPIFPTAIQGGTSYTVQRNQFHQVIQFRALDLDIIRLGLIQRVYDKFVPRCLYHGLLGTLHFYIWDLVSGPAFCRVRREMFTVDTEQSGHCLVSAG
jgi:hypothetical protein